MRHPLRSFIKGLWVAGGRDAIPQDALRRATGVHQLRQGVLRSALPSSAKSVISANQYVRFQGSRYQGQAASLLRDGAIIGASDLDGTRLSFLRMPPQAGIADYLFVGGGGALRKVDAAGAVSDWGIPAPSGTITVDLSDPRTKLIDEVDATGGADWNIVDPGGGSSIGSQASSGIEGGAAVILTTKKSETKTVIEKDITVDLTEFDTSWTGAPEDSPSVEQDYIEFWVSCGEPDRLVAIEISFSLNNTTFENDTFTRRVPVVDDLQRREIIGIGQNADSDADVINGDNDFAPGRSFTDLLNRTTQSVIPRVVSTWIRVHVSKASFERAGTGAFGWADVQAVRLNTITFGDGRSVSVIFDRIRLSGGYGIVGRYQYLITYKNNTTGSRSDPNATASVIADVVTGTELFADRQPIGLTNIPQPPIGQVDIIEIWRTVGNGAAFFKCGEISPPASAFVDGVADFDAMFSGATVLALPELPIDNAPPPDTVGYVLPTSHNGRAWWLDDAAADVGHVFYSAIGRPESMVDFVNVTETDEPLQALARWNDVLYAFSSRRVFRIIGDDEPFTSQEVFGAPGTLDPDTVAVAPQGILYLALDGVRLFTGASAELVAYGAIGPAFRGLTVEGMTTIASPALGRTATVLNDDYYLADGAQTLILNLRDGTWRRLAVAASTLYAEPDSTEILASITGATIGLDDTAGAVASTFEVQTASVRFSTDVLAVVRRVFFDIDTQGQDIVPVLVLDDTEVTLPALNTASRQLIEMTTNSRTYVAAIRLTGTVLAIVRVYGIEFDIYLPGGTPR